MSVEVDIEELGRELGEVLAETPEHERFEEAKRAVEENEEAQAKIREFENARQAFLVKRQTGEADQGDVESVKELQEELHSLPVMEEYVEAKEALAERLEPVNVAISEPLEVDFGGEAGGCCHD